MEEQLEYFHIELEMLGEEQLFPFHIHIFNPISEQYTPFLFGNSPLTKEKLAILVFISERGGEIAIQDNQKNTFLTALNITESDIPSLQVTEGIHALEEKREQKLKELAKREETEGKFHFRNELSKANKRDDFYPMIAQARDEIMTFSLRTSPTVSLSTYLAEKLMYEDNYTNRIVALSYHLAKGCGMVDEESLGELVVAAFFCHLGYTQMDFHYSHKAQIELNDKQRKLFHKHPGLSQHVIRKSGIDISSRANNIFYQHHERVDGTGFPDNKTGEHLDPMSLVLGCSAHLLEYMTGRVTGTKTDLTVIINNLKNKTLAPGLELGFGETVFDSIIYLLNTEESAKKSAA